jgi:hypothetical protein
MAVSFSNQILFIKSSSQNLLRIYSFVQSQFSRIDRMRPLHMFGIIRVVSKFVGIIRANVTGIRSLARVQASVVSQAGFKSELFLTEIALQEIRIGISGFC